MTKHTRNIHAATVDGFGDEWSRFDHRHSSEDYSSIFERYFSIFPWDVLPVDAQGFDMGCGSGRWARFVAPRVGTLHCVDPSAAIDVARRNLSDQPNCLFYQAASSDEILPERTMDFGYSLGVLHHAPDTGAALADCVRLLKPGAPLLIYLYYSLDNRSYAYRSLWRASNSLRRIVSRLPYLIRNVICEVIAMLVYWPFARTALLIEKIGFRRAEALPLGFYRHLNVYAMRTDARDRFGTPLEHRFSRTEILSMMEKAGLERIVFSEEMPFWCAVGYRKDS